MTNDLRIGYWQYYYDDAFENIKELIKTYLSTIDEVSLFTEFSHHGYYSLDTVKERAVVYKKRIDELHRLGLKSVGLNVLDTIGHINEGWEIFEKPPYQTLMGHDGEVSRSCFCINSEGYLNYIGEKYKILAGTNPDFLWVDDDMRLHNHGIKFGCFCDDCIQKFNQKYHYKFARESLVKALNKSEEKELRHLWLTNNSDSIIRLLSLIEESVHSINETIELGLMTYDIPWGFYSYPQYDKWLKALKAKKVRPGGGFYTDITPTEFINKSLETGRQVEFYKKAVTDIQYELENFPYQKLSKSVKIVILECLASLFNGTRGIALNVLPISYGKFNTDIFEAFKENYQLFNKIDEISHEFENAGLFPMYSLDYSANREVNEDWFSFVKTSQIYQASTLCEIGIPVTMSRKMSCGSILIGDMADGFSDEELLKMLSGGVLMDGKALEVLCKRGLGEYCGAKISSVHDNSVFERLTDHALNGEFKGNARDASISFWGGDYAYLLEPFQDCDVLSDLYTLTEERLGATVTAYINNLGGRVCILGYMPWKFIHSYEKHYQIHQICRWISDNQLPVHLNSCAKITPYVRVSPQSGEMLIMLFNSFLDSAKNVDIEIKVNDLDGFFYLDQQGNETKIEGYKKSGDYIKITIDKLDAFDYKIIRIKR